MSLPQRRCKCTNGKHFDIEKRKIINHLLSQQYSLSDMSIALAMDPTSISKEIKRNRYLLEESVPVKGKECNKIKHFPYVCNSCQKRYRDCTLRQYLYNPVKAQDMADYRLVNSRKGINMTKQEFDYLNKTIKEGVQQDKSIYDIVNSDNEIAVSVQTVYRYINNNLLSTKAIDLPYAVTLKKRKKEKEYEYSENNQIDRSNRTFMDYLAFKGQYPNVYCIQMDFLGSIKSDSKSILTLTIADLHFVMLFLIEKKNSSKIVSLFNKLEMILDIDNFKKIFPCILTDRDPSFSNYLAIETSNITGEKRTNVFYCDPYVSNQKANVENMNHQLRHFFPKKSSVDEKTNQEMLMVMNNINHRKVSSLCGYSPIEAFISVYGEKTYKQLLTIFD